MMKKLLPLSMMVLLAGAAFAQQARLVQASASPAANNAPKPIKAGSGLLARPTTTLTTCAEVNNPVPAGWTANTWFYGSVAGGFINGQNSAGDYEKAMFFNTSSMSFTKLNQVDVDFGVAYSATPTKTVALKIYDGTSNNPGGTLLGSQVITMGDIMANTSTGYVTSFYFPAGISLPASKKFFLSIDVSGLTLASGDSLSITATGNNETTNAAWEKWNDNTWHSYPTSYTSPSALNLSFFMFPYLSNGPVVTNFTASSTNICAGQSITYDLTGSSIGAGYFWQAYTGATSSYTSSSVLTPTVTYPAAGTFSTYLTSGNDCGALNAAVATVTVKPLPSITASPSSTTVCSGTNIILNGGGGTTTYTWTNGVSNGVAFTPSTGSYTVSGTGSNGCVNSAVASVVVNPTPTVSSSPSATTVCSGSSVTLSGNGATSYAWTGGITNGVAFAASSSLTYTVTGTSNGCSGTAVATVSVNTLPTVSVNATSTMVCSGANVTLNGTGAASYTWSNGVTDGVPFAPSGTQTYTVTGTDANGCTGTNTVNVAVSVCTGIPSLASTNNHIAIYPNPGHGMFTISTKGLSSDATVEVYNSIGKLVYQENLSVETQAIRANLANGVYIVRVMDKGAVQSVQKFISQ